MASSIEVDIQRTANQALAQLPQAKGCHGAPGQNEHAEGASPSVPHLICQEETVARGKGNWDQIQARTSMSPTKTLRRLEPGGGA